MAQLETYEILLVRAGKLEDMGSARRVLPHQLPVERGMGSVARYLLTWVTFSKVASPAKMIRSYWISWCTSYRHEAAAVMTESRKLTSSTAPDCLLFQPEQLAFP